MIASLPSRSSTSSPSLCSETLPPAQAVYLTMLGTAGSLSKISKLGLKP
jgi:hypothetical protein